MKKTPSRWDVKGKKALVVGLGKSGLAAARYLAGRGAHVFATDERPAADLAGLRKSLPASVQVETGGNSFMSGRYDLVVVSPGVPWDHPDLKKARRRGAVVWPEIELGWRAVKPRQTIAVTGTNGKTTTTTMVGEILKAAGRKVIVAGNIGTPLTELADVIDSRTDLVVEVSSYQMEGHQTFHPDVAVVLNITPDHLARHKTMRRYAAAKKRLLINMTKADTVIYNRDDKWCREIVKGTPAKKVSFPSADLMPVASYTVLRGQHNLENAMAAVAAVRAVGLDDEQISSGLRGFKGVRHRIQLVGTKRGVTYVNDSKATNVDSTLVALKSFSEPTILLLGGEHKGSSYKPLLPFLKMRTKLVIAYGEAKPIIVKDLSGKVPLATCDTLDQAVARAAKAAEKGDVVLLSPACASFDQYKNYEHRGDHFIELVGKLPK